MEGLETVNNWVLAVHPEHRDEFISRWNNAITNQTSISQFEFRWRVTSLKATFILLLNCLRDQGGR